MARQACLPVHPTLTEALLVLVWLSWLPQVLGVGATASVAELKAARQAKRWSMAALGARAAYRQLKREAGRRDVDMAWLDNMVQREMMSRLRGAIDQFWESNI